MSPPKNKLLPASSIGSYCGNCHKIAFNRDMLDFTTLGYRLQTDCSLKPNKCIMCTLSSTKGSTLDNVTNKK